MTVSEILQLTQIIVVSLGAVGIGFMQLQILRRTDKRDAYVKVIDAIRELKKWVLTEESGIRTDQGAIMRHLVRGQTERRKERFQQAHCTH